MKRLRHPIRAIEEPFGKAGLVVAVIALVAALGGTALAAKGALTGKQKKEVEKIAKKFAGQPGANGAPGAQGPAGPAGANGKDGANGEKGATGAAGTPGTPGTNGKSVKLVNSAPPGCAEGGFTYEVEGSGVENEVCNGETGEGGGGGGEFPNFLPEGKTETGTWSLLVGESKEKEEEVEPEVFVGTGERQEHEDALAPISFNIPLEHQPVVGGVNIIKPGETTTHCQGSAVNPSADPGYLCIYARVAIGSEEDTEWLYHLTSVLFFGGSGATLISARGVPHTGGFGGWAVTAAEEEEP